MKMDPLKMPMGSLQKSSYAFLEVLGFFKERKENQQ